MAQLSAPARRDLRGRRASYENSRHGCRCYGDHDRAERSAARRVSDYYVAAMPVEVMSGFVTEELKAAAPSLANLSKLRLAWMNGIQFFLKQDIPLEFGHTIYADSPWALTSISQRQFWQQAPLSNYGDGSLGGILSLDISEWEQPGIVYGKPAKQCTAEEIKNEVWAQVKVHLNIGGAEIARDENVISWFLDPDIEFPNPSAVTNLEPLLINNAGSLAYRPEASTEIPNLFLASDYVEDIHRSGYDGGCQRSRAPGRKRYSRPLRIYGPTRADLAVSGTGVLRAAA